MFVEFSQLNGSKRLFNSEQIKYVVISDGGHARVCFCDGSYQDVAESFEETKKRLGGQ